MRPTTLPCYPPRAPQKRSSPPRRAANRPSGAGQRRRCQYCGKLLPVNTKGSYHGNSCRVQMSKLKRKLADAACMTAWGWQPGEGERLIARYGLPLMEKALAVREIYWHPELLDWIQEAGDNAD